MPRSRSFPQQVPDPLARVAPVHGQVRGRISARRVLTASLLVDVLDVVTNLAVALWTGSAVVFAEMAQGAADVIGSLLLVVGERRAQRPHDAEHPFGYRREVFFWALLSAMVMLVVGAGLSFVRGYHQWTAPRTVTRPGLGLAVLVLSVLTNAWTVRLALSHLLDGRGGVLAALRRPGRPLVKTSLLRDAVGTLSAILGLIALTLYALSGSVLFDALGALTVGALLAILALVLIAETRALIAGRALPEDELERLRRVVLETPGVSGLNRLAAVYAGSDEVLVDLDLDLAEDLGTDEIEALLDRLQARVRRVVPGARTVRVDLNSPPPRPVRDAPG